MALTYLSLVNTVLKRLNEVQLTSSNFATAAGFHATVKDYINDAIRKINTAEFQWRFNYEEQSLTLTPGTYKYSIPSDVKVVDWDSFKIDKDVSDEWEARKLSVISYDEWMQRYFEDQENSGLQDQPQKVVRQQLGQFFLYPTPDEAYVLKYDTFIQTDDLSLHSDTTTIPDIFKEVIISYALYLAYMFRSNDTAAQGARIEFNNGLKNMRTILGNPYEKVRDSRTNFYRW